MVRPPFYLYILQVLPGRLPVTHRILFCSLQQASSLFRPQHMRGPSPLLGLALLLLLQSERVRALALHATILHGEAVKRREGKVTNCEGRRAARKELKKQLHVHLARLKELEMAPSSVACQSVHQEIDAMERRGLAVSAET